MTPIFFLGVRDDGRVGERWQNGRVGCAQVPAAVTGRGGVRDAAAAQVLLAHRLGGFERRNVRHQVPEPVRSRVRPAGHHQRHDQEVL